MKEFKFEQIFKDGSVITTTEKGFNHINDALAHARKWMKADDNLKSVKIISPTFTETISRP